MMNLSDDTEELEDFIRLDFAELQASENLQLLDLGIIDLECDSEAECTSIKEPESFHGQPDLHSPVTTSHSNKFDLKPMCIKLVDCYKFPWYFDKFKDIIEHKIAIDQSVEVDDGILDNRSMELSKEQVDKSNFVDMSVADSVTMQRQANDCRIEVAELNKEIDVIATEELLENNKLITGAKSIRNNVRNNKMDFDIQIAMEQRKKYVVDLKRNIGLVGMKILRLPNKIPSKLLVDIGISKQLKKSTKANIEKGQENKQEKGPTSGSHVKALDKVLMNVTSTMPVFQETIEGMKDGVLTQNITENSSPGRFIPSISALEEKKTISNDTPLDQRCNIENEFSLELSVSKIAEEMYGLVRPNKYAGNINQTIVPNSCNTLTTPKKVTEEKNIKRSKYQSQKYIAEGTRKTKMIDPIPILPKKRNKDRINSHWQTKISEIIDISDQMSPKPPSRKPENMKNHKTKDKLSTIKPKPKIVLSTKKLNKLTEAIIKIKEKQQKQSSLIEYTKSLNPSRNTIPSSTLSKSISENRSLPKEIEKDPNYKYISTQEKLWNENDELKDIRNSSPKPSIVQLQNSNRNDYENAPNKDNNPQNMMKSNVLTDSYVLVKTPEKGAENVSKNNYTESAQIVTESSMTVHRDESNKLPKNKSSQNTEKIIVEVKLIDSTKKKLRQHHGSHRFPAANPIETGTNNFAIPTIVSNRETIISSTKFDTVSNHNLNVTSPAVNTTTQNNQSSVNTKPLTVYNSMQAHILYKPSESSYQTFRQSQCNAVRFASHIPQLNQPIYNYAGHPLQNLTNQAINISPHIDTRPPLSGVNEKIVPQMLHRLPMPPLQPMNFGDPMLNGIGPNMPTLMRHPGPNGGFGAQMQSNPRAMSPFGVSSQISRPLGTISSQMPVNYPQIPISEMQSNDALWSGPLSCIPPPPPITHLPTSQDISTSSPKSLPQSMDSSIIGRNINGIVKKINITAPVIKQKEEIASKAGKIKIDKLESDTSMPLYDEIHTHCFENTEPVKTKKEMLRILDTELQRVSSRFDVLIPADGIQSQAMQNSTISDRLNSKKDNLLSQGKLGKLSNDTTHEKFNCGTRKINSVVENFIKVDRVPSKDHQKKSLPQKKENQHKSNHYLINFKRKPKEKKDKKKEIPPKKCNESVKNGTELVSDLTELESDSIKISANQSSCIPKQIKHNEITKKPTSNHLKFIQDSKKGNKSVKLASKSSKIIFVDLFGDGMDADYEKDTSDKKSTGKRHSGVVHTEKTSEKSYESSVNLKRPANDEKSALSPKYRPGPLSKKKKLNDQEKVNLHQSNKKQILQSKTYSDPILPIPTYEKILSNIPSYLCFREHMKNSSVTSNSRCDKTSGRVNSKTPDPANKRIEKEKERLKLDKAESIKKISLYEYKKRNTSERKVDHEAKDNYRKKHVEMHRRPSHADSDLGYDSDSTVKL